MPTLQVLPSVPTFGSKLAQTLGQAVGDVGSSYIKGKREREAEAKDQQILQGLPQNASKMDYINAVSRLSKGGQKRYQTLLENTMKLESAERISQNKLASTQQKDLAKQQIKTAEKEEEKKNVGSALDQLDAMIPYTGSTLAPGKGFIGAENPILSGLLGVGGAIGQPVPNREGFEKRQEFDQLGFWVTDKIYTHFNKGIISNVKFNSIRKDLAPRADLPERVNKARIASQRKILALPSDISPEKFNAILDQELNKVKNLEKKEGVSNEPKTVKMFTPGGEVVDVPANQVDAALERNTGWRLAEK